MNYPDGSSPPGDIIQRWVQLLVETFDVRRDDQPCIAIHCVAGLGRLVEFSPNLYLTIHL